MTEAGVRSLPSRARIMQLVERSGRLMLTETQACSLEAGVAHLIEQAELAEVSIRRLTQELEQMRRASVSGALQVACSYCGVSARAVCRSVLLPGGVVAAAHTARIDAVRRLAESSGGGR